jgi:hypothetical protein
MRRAVETIGATITGAMDGKKGIDVAPLTGPKAAR